MPRDKRPDRESPLTEVVIFAAGWAILFAIGPTIFFSLAMGLRMAIFGAVTGATVAAITRYLRGRGR